MRILIGCECSQVVCAAFRKLGFEAYSCDLLPAYGEHPEWHLKMDVFRAINIVYPTLGIFHPECTRLTNSANRWYKPEYSSRFPNIHEERQEAVHFFKRLTEVDIPHTCIENPVGIMSTYYRKPDQIIQPYEFGDAEKKTTCLWLKELPKLVPTDVVEPVLIEYKSGKGRSSKLHYDTLGMPEVERKRLRSQTFQGIADAMADQWGNYLINLYGEHTNRVRTRDRPANRRDYT